MAASIWNPNGQVSVPELPAVAPVTFVKGTAGNPGINFVGDTETGIWSQADGYLNFAVNGVNVLTIDSSGNIVANKFVSGVEIDVASAAVTDIGSQLSNTVRITGTNNITSFGTTYRGTIFVRFASALILTHNASTLILPGAANISISAGDTLIAIPKATAGVSDGWFVVGYTSLVPLLNAVTSITGAASGMPISNVISINGGQLAGLRNRIINGDMRVAQRGTSGTVANGAYALDRWLLSYTGSATSWAQATGTYFGTPASSALQILGIAGNTGVTIQQRIESLNSRDLAGQTVTLSYWVYQSTGASVGVLSSAYYANSTDNFASQTLIANSGSTTVPNATWTRIVWNIAIPAGGVTGLMIQPWSNQTALVAGQTLYISNVQLELGSVATVFEQRLYGLELALCQRYYFASKCSHTYGSTGSTYQSAYTVNFPVTMRVIPTMAAGAATANTLASTTAIYALDANTYSVFLQTSGAGNASYAAPFTATAEM